MRTISVAVTTLVLFSGFVSSQANQMEEKKTMNVKRITPVLFVKEIEPILPFWVDHLGFTKTIKATQAWEKTCPQCPRR